jgi:hypothetical protein
MSSSAYGPAVNNGQNGQPTNCVVSAGQQINCCANNNNTTIISVNNNNNSNVGYDPSYTSATVYSADSISNIHAASGLNQAEMGVCGMPMVTDAIIPADRRPSNYYLFEDDSTHEFDDEGKKRVYLR